MRCQRGDGESKRGVTYVSTSGLDSGRSYTQTILSVNIELYRGSKHLNASSLDILREDHSLEIFLNFAEIR